VLAAGEGRRLVALTRGVPKQFWSANGHSSLLAQTLVRVGPLVAPDHTVTVVDRTHRSYVVAQPEPRRLGHVVFQACDRGTAAGVLLGLCTVIETAPDALVLLTPSDHGVAQADEFLLGISSAADNVRSGRHDIVLFGAEPSTPETGYGWITLSDSRSSGTSDIQPVSGFVEKPSTVEAHRLLAAGSVWNTMVLVARASTLFDLYQRHLPELTDRVAGVFRLPAGCRETALVETYRDLPSSDFSNDILARAAGLDVYVWPAAIGWSDLGTPERLGRWQTDRARDFTPWIAGPRIVAPAR